jgi:hypothetical protein
MDVVAEVMWVGVRVCMSVIRVIGRWRWRKLCRCLQQLSMLRKASPKSARSQLSRLTGKLVPLSSNLLVLPPNPFFSCNLSLVFVANLQGMEGAVFLRAPEESREADEVGVMNFPVLEVPIWR